MSNDTENNTAQDSLGSQDSGPEALLAMLSQRAAERLKVEEFANKPQKQPPISTTTASISYNDLVNELPVEEATVEIAKPARPQVKSLTVSEEDGTEHYPTITRPGASNPSTSVTGVENLDMDMGATPKPLSDNVGMLPPLPDVDAQEEELMSDEEKRQFFTDLRYELDNDDNAWNWCVRELPEDKIADWTDELFVAELRSFLVEYFTTGRGSRFDKNPTLVWNMKKVSDPMLREPVLASQN